MSRQVRSCTINVGYDKITSSSDATSIIHDTVAIPIPIDIIIASTCMGCLEIRYMPFTTHELNQPLSVIKTSSSFIIKKVRKNETIKDEILKTLAEEIDSHVDRASKIINHMREFGRKSDIKKETVLVNEPLEKALEIFSQQLKLREINVVKELEKGLPPILADPNRLEQVFINLLINARDAIEEKTDKANQEGKPKEIFLKTAFKKGMVTIEVKDTGVGIPKSILDKIFEPFFTTKKVVQGTGLGLSISYGIIQDYGGHIRAESREGVGSNFIIHFPVPNEAK